MLPNLERAQDMPGRLKGSCMWGEQFSSWELLGLIEKDLQLVKESATSDVQSRFLQAGGPASTEASVQEPASVFHGRAGILGAGVRDQGGVGEEGGQWPNHRVLSALVKTDFYSE